MEQIAELIRQNDPAAINAVQELDNLCIQTTDNESLFNIAIQYKNSEIIDFFLQNSICLDFAPTMDASTKKKATFIASQISDINDAEEAITKACGPATCWQRTPLLQACRLKDIATMQKLINRGAKRDAKDILGYSAAELCLETGGRELFQTFLEQCIQKKKKFNVSGNVLYETINSPALFAKILDFCKLNADARRVMFSIACANLDIELVKILISQGYVPTKMVTNFTNPIFEACTSSRLYDLKLPGYQRLAHIYAKRNIFSSDRTAVSTEELLKARNNEEFDALISQGVQPPVSNHQVEPLRWIPRDILDEQLEKRIALVKLLVNNGITPVQTVAHCGVGFVEEVAQSGEVALLIELEKLGFDMALDDKEDLEYMVSLLQDAGHSEVISWLRNKHQ